MDESKLLDAASRFDPEALRMIFDTYSPVVYKYALRLCRDANEADNIVGDVFALLLEQLASGKGPRTNLGSYLFQITYHVVINQTRDERHSTQLEVADFRAEHDSLVASHAEEDIALGSVINAMFTELSPDQRQILILRFVEGCSTQETAEIVHKSVNNVKVMQNRALEKLRKILNKEDTN